MRVKQISSSKTQDTGDESAVDLTGTFHHTLMSKDLMGVVDGDNIYGDHAHDVSPDDPRRPRMTPKYVCGVTLSDEEVRSCDVLSFSRTNVCWQCTISMSLDVSDDICTSPIVGLNITAPSGTSVVEVKFDVDTPQPNLACTITEDHVIVTFTFVVEDTSEHT